VRKTIITELAAKQHDYVVEQYHHLHQHPEKGLFEYETAKHIRRELDAMGIRWIPTADTGTIGILEGNGECDKILALRADIDALELDERTELPFASKVPGMMHGCGHDGHTAMLLGAARALQELGQENRHGTVYLLFQPGEETTRGAKKVVDSGELNGISAIYGQHLMMPCRTGKVLFRAGHMMAGARQFSIHVVGKGGHGSNLSQCIDPVLPALMIALGLESMIPQNVSPLREASLCVGAVNAGVRFNIVPEDARIEGNYRYFYHEDDALLQRRIRELAESTARAYGTEAQITFSDTVPPLTNDEKLAEILRGSAANVVGEENVNEAEPAMGSEDFSEFSALCPEVFAFVGIANPEKGITAGHHSSYFRIDEDALDIGVAMHIQFVLNYFAAQQS